VNTPLLYISVLKRINQVPNKNPCPYFFIHAYMIVSSVFFVTNFWVIFHTKNGSFFGGKNKFSANFIF
jgi:hypothetical protein